MDASKTRFLVLGLLVVGLGIVLGTALWLKLAPGARLGVGGSADDERLKMYGSVPEFALTERNGEAIQLAQLRGKIWIADFIYTNCQDTCPLQTATMAKLQEEFAARPEIQLVSFSVDPERDTPRVLTEYAGRYHADAKRWFFLTGQRSQLLNLIQEGFHLSVATIPTDTDINAMIPHSPRFVLMDKEARIRGYYDSRDREALLRLRNDVEDLLKGYKESPAMANARNRKGKQLPVKRIMRAGPNWPLFVLAVLGLGLTGYLSYSALFSERVAFCTAGAGCDVVLNSRWSTLFGVPTSLLGFSYLRAAGRGRVESRRRQSMALDLCHLALRFALQHLSHVGCLVRTQGHLSLLSHLAWLDGGDLHSYGIAAAGELGEIQLGTLAGQERRRRLGHGSRHPLALCRLLGRCAGTGRSLGARPGREPVAQRR